MKITRRNAMQAGLGSTLFMSAITAVRADGPVFGAIEGADEFWLATDAYIYGDPLVTVELTGRVFTNVAQVESEHAPMGQILKMRRYPDASYRDVTAPDADTLYTTAFFDVGKEPWVLSIPEMGDRYYLLPMLDGWTTVFAVPGKRTTGGGAQMYAITGPGWSGASVRRKRAEIIDQHRLVPRQNLLHRDARGLCRGPCAAGSFQAGAT